MKSERIFIGPIYSSKGKTENNVLIQARNGKYLEIQHTKNLLQRLALEISMLQNKRFIGTYVTQDSYINTQELRPYISVSTEINLKRVREIHKKKK